MARHYKGGMGLDQGFLLPVDVREWLPKDHPVWFFIDVMDRLDLSRFGVRHGTGGVGRAGYHPRMLLGVLLFGYAFGQRSSRTLERLCQQDVAFRVLAGGLSPDHTTLARFRAEHEDAMTDVFAQVLVLCARSGLVKLSTVSIDGTKIAADASGLRNRDLVGLGKELERARAEAAARITAAGAVDAVEDEQFGDGRGDQVRADLVDSDPRVVHLNGLIDDLEQVERDKAQAAQDEQAAAREFVERCADPDQPIPAGRAPAGVDPVAVAEARLKRAKAKRVAWREQHTARAQAEPAGPGKSPGRKLIPDQEHHSIRDAERKLERARAKAPDTGPTYRQKRAAKKPRVNMTDPESKTLASPKGWVQGYNVQLAASDDQIVIAVQVFNTGQDATCFAPMLRAAERASEQLQPHLNSPSQARIGHVLADAGYLSTANLTMTGPDRLIATSKRHKQDPTEPQRPPPDSAGPIKQMAYRMRTRAAREIYQRRGVTVEPVNGHLKDNIGLRTMSRRGLKAAQAEATTAVTALNLLKLMRHGLAIT